MSKEIYILPISGGCFPFQLSAYMLMLESEMHPDVCLTSSGGNVATYLMLMADWNKDNLVRILKTVNPSMFLNSWGPSTLISLIIGFFKGSAFNQGKGFIDFFETYLVEDSIKNLEIWTEAYNDVLKKPQLFCNKKKEECILEDEYIDCYTNQCLKPIYLNGNVAEIAKVGVASASIPALVPPMCIGDHQYIDGGVHSSSPLNIMRNSIKALKKYHITHIVGADINIGCNDYNQNIIQTGMTAIDCLIKGFIKLDRTLSLDIVCHYEDNPKYNQIVFKCNKSNLDIIREVKTKLDNSMLEIYPHYSINKIDLMNFTSDQIIEAIKLGYENSYCRFWWIGEVSLCDRIDKIEDCDKIITCNSNGCCAKDL